MKVMTFILRFLGVIFALISLLGFASDFMPVDGFSFGSWTTASGENMYFKIVSTEEQFNPLLYGFLFLVSSVTCFTLPILLKKYIGTKPGL